MRQATASYSRLVREEAVREFPVTEHEVSAMAAKDSRPVREEVVESSDDYSKVSVVSSKDPVVVRRGQEAGMHALWPPLEWPASPGLVEMWSSHRGGRTTGTAWLWRMNPEVEGPCLQGSPVPVFSGSRPGNGSGQSCVPSAGRH